MSEPAYSRVRILLFFAMLLLPVSFGQAGELKLNRGINVWPLVGNVCRSKDPDEKYCKKLFPPLDIADLEQKFSQLKEVGFDFVRVPIDAGPFIDLGEAAAPWIERLKTFIEIAEGRGLSVIIDYHHGGVYKYTDLAADPELMVGLGRFYARLAKRLRDGKHERVIIEVLNEPTTSCDDPSWDRWRLALHSAIREAVKDFPIMVGGACWNSISSLLRIDPKQFDANTYYTFHFYDPYFFTHQGATWNSNAGIKVLTGVPWPAAAGSLDQTIAAIDANLEKNPTYQKVGAPSREQAVQLARKYFAEASDVAKLEAELDKVTAWADRNGVPRSHVVMGEFGVLKRERHYFGADMASTIRWLEAVRTIAEARRLPWAMWNYTKGMALTLNDETDELHTPLLTALGLRPPSDRRAPQ